MFHDVIQVLNELKAVIMTYIFHFRYGACVCCEGKEVMVRDGPLDQLLEHLPNIKDQIVKGSCDNFKLELPKSIGDRTWFTKATVLRSQSLHLYRLSC